MSDLGGRFCRGGYPGVVWAGKSYSARRLLLALRGVEVGKNTRIVATCGERACMNPRHLVVTDQSGVTLKAIADGKVVVGFPRSIRDFMRNASKSKMPVTENEKVYQMRQQGASYARIGKHYGIHRSDAFRTVKRWKALGVGPWRQEV